MVDKLNHDLVVAQGNAAIGVLDSGVGGLSVLRHIREQLPAESLLYFADSAHAPYGSKPAAYIVERSRVISRFLLERGAKAIVVACNTATAAAISTLRQELTVPIIGMEPAVKPAAAATRSGVVGVLATTGTLQSAQFAALLEHYGQHIQVVTQACVGLVECIERGELETQATRSLVGQYLQPLLDAGADTVVLGCTHYPFVKDLIADLAGPQVALIDTGAAVARQLAKRLQQNALLAPEDATPNITLFSNSGEADAKSVLARLWPAEAHIKLLHD